MENVYANESYAGGYAELDWQGTYYLLKRDIPDLFRRHVRGGRALDFGCGAGRSTRLLRSCGFETIGIDVSAAMVERARTLDPDQDYRVIEDGSFSGVETSSYDLILACFPFDNIPGEAHKVSLMSGLKRLLAPDGVFVNVVSSAEIYWHEWATFTTAPFPENRSAKHGDIVKIITKDFAGHPVCDDVFCDDDSYRRIYDAAGLRVIDVARPMGRDSDPVPWISETQVSPWVIWLLR